MRVEDLLEAEWPPTPKGWHRHNIAAGSLFLNGHFVHPAGHHGFIYYITLNFLKGPAYFILTTNDLKNGPKYILYGPDNTYRAVAESILETDDFDEAVMMAERLMAMVKGRSELGEAAISVLPTYPGKWVKSSDYIVPAWVWTRHEKIDFDEDDPSTEDMWFIFDLRAVPPRDGNLEPDEIGHFVLRFGNDATNTHETMMIADSFEQIERRFALEKGRSELGESNDERPAWLPPTPPGWKLGVITREDERDQRAVFFISSIGKDGAPHWDAAVVKMPNYSHLVVYPESGTLGPEIRSIHPDFATAVATAERMLAMQRGRSELGEGDRSIDFTHASDSCPPERRDAVVRAMSELGLDAEWNDTDGTIRWNRQGAMAVLDCRSGSLRISVLGNSVGTIGRLANPYHPTFDIAEWTFGKMWIALAISGAMKAEPDRWSIEGTYHVRPFLKAKGGSDEVIFHSWSLALKQDGSPATEVTHKECPQGTDAVAIASRKAALLRGRTELGEAKTPPAGQPPCPEGWSVEGHGTKLVIYWPSRQRTTQSDADCWVTWEPWGEQSRPLIEVYYRPAGARTGNRILQTRKFDEACRLAERYAAMLTGRSELGESAHGWPAAPPGWELVPGWSTSEKASYTLPGEKGSIRAFVTGFRTLGVPEYYELMVDESGRSYSFHDLTTACAAAERMMTMTRGRDELGEGR